MLNKAGNGSIIPRRLVRARLMFDAGQGRRQFFITMAYQLFGYAILPGVF